MRKSMFVQAVLIASVFCAAQASIPAAFADVPFLFKNDLRGTEANYRGSRVRESKIIGFNKNIAERKGDDLIIKYKGKEVAKFTNEKKNRDGSVLIYSLVDVNAKNHIAVIELGRDENESFMVINYETGETSDLGSLPYWAPSGTRFAEMNTGVSEFSPALVHIWRADKSGFHREWELVGYVASSGRWRDDEHIDFVMHKYEAERNEDDDEGELPEEDWTCEFHHAFAHSDHSWICRQTKDIKPASSAPRGDSGD